MGPVSTVMTNAERFARRILSTDQPANMLMTHSELEYLARAYIRLLTAKRRRYRARRP
jgi:hypothetical protein